MARKRIGELLIEKGVITQAQLDQSLALHQRTKIKLGAALVQNGHLSEEELVATLSEALDISIVHLPAIVPDWSAVHMLRARFCELNDLFPFAIEGKGGPKKQLVVALSDPLHGPTLQEIEFTTGLPVSPRLATMSAIRAAISRYYHKTGGAPGPSAPGAPSTTAGSKSSLPKVAERQPVLEDEPIVMGTVLLDEEPPANVVTKPAAPKALGAPAGKKSSTGEFEALFAAGKGDEDPTAKLEKKFWALMRIMARKGLVTKDEFAQELKDGEE